jgi:hypothetical protein
MVVAVIVRTGRAAPEACVDDPGVASSDPKKNGCPPPADADADGIPDERDACVSEPGPSSDGPQRNGCPVPVDTDADGITDDVDACPTDAGVAHTDPKKNGCPKAEGSGSRVGRITMAGVITEFATPSVNSGPSAIATGPDGNLSFAEQAVGVTHIVLITPTGAITEFPTPSGNQAVGLAVGSDGNIWFTEPFDDKVGRLTP